MLPDFSLLLIVKKELGHTDPDKLASLNSSHPVLPGFSLLLIVKKELGHTDPGGDLLKVLEGGHDN